MLEGIDLAIRHVCPADYLIVLVHSFGSDAFKEATVGNKCHLEALILKHFWKIAFEVLSYKLLGNLCPPIQHIVALDSEWKLIVHFFEIVVVGVVDGVLIFVNFVHLNR